MDSDDEAMQALHEVQDAYNVQGIPLFFKPLTSTVKLQVKVQENGEWIPNPLIKKGSVYAYVLTGRIVDSYRLAKYLMPQWPHNYEIFDVEGLEQCSIKEAQDGVRQVWDVEWSAC